MSQTKQTLESSGTYLLNTGGQNVSADGVRFQFTETGTQSIVLAINTAPPGAAVSLQNIAYMNASLVEQSAGTAITASGLAYVSPQNGASDIYGVLTSTSGTLVVEVSPASLGAPDGPIAAGDVLPGTFASNTGGTGAFATPGAFTVANGLTVTTGGAAIGGGGAVTGTWAVTGDTTVSGTVGMGGSAGAATSAVSFTKAVTGIANNSATQILTLTIPNAAHSGSVLVRATSSLGAGGAIGANEASATNCYIITYTRTAGVNATAAISSAFGAAATAVAGAATVTGAVTVGTVSGAVGAVNTFPINVTVVRSGGSSTNHTCVVEATILNANASGATLA